MAKLSQLFDMQKIAECDSLSSLIDETHNRYNDNIVELDDDMLELAAAGTARKEDDLIRVSCSVCGNVFMTTRGKKETRCPECKKLIKP